MEWTRERGMNTRKNRKVTSGCHCREIFSPVGRLALRADGEYLLAIDFVLSAGKDRLLQESSPVLLETERQLLAYFFSGLKSFELPLRPCGTPFQLAVWQAMRDIPFGITKTYGEIAEVVGGRNKARAVGQAANRNPLPIVIPCHRVVGTGNTLTGFAPGVDKKAILLNHEQGAEIW